MKTFAGFSATLSWRIFASLSAAVIVVLIALPNANAGQSSFGHLKPAPLGEGQCEYFQLPNGSTFAQIAISHTNCSVAEKVASGAISARGASYHANGFACTATKEGLHSAWSTAWGKTYYAYSCSDGIKQVAFNWGTDYTY